MPPRKAIVAAEVERALEGEWLPAEEWKPYPYQRRAMKFLLEHAAGGLLLDPGLGKTSINLSAFKLLQHEGVARRALVVAPLRVCHLVWPAEVRQWKHLEHLKLRVLHGRNKDVDAKAKADVFCINPEGLDWLMSGQHWRQLQVDTLIVDESTKFKKTTTQRFSNLRRWLPRFDRRWINTGSFASESLLDLHGQMFIVDLGKALSPYVTYYQHKFFERTGFGGYGWKVRDEYCEREIYKLIKPYLLRMSGEEYLQLPQLVPAPMYVELPDHARDEYEALEAQLFLLLDAGEVNAVNNGVLNGKLRQLAGGAVYLSPDVDPVTGVPTRGPKRWVEVHTAKLEALTELIDELAGQPMLIGYEYGHELERLKKLLGKEAEVMGGGSIKQDLALERAWNAGEVRYLLGHAQSVGHGLNLQRGNAMHVTFFTAPHSYELYDQFLRRVRRQGNKAKRVVVHTLLTKDTVEEAHQAMRQAKRGGQDRLYEALLTYRDRKRRQQRK